MDFLVLSELFEKLENTPKRLEKILVLRDFLIENPKEGPLIFDLICGNYQREISKKTVGISLKTIFDVISFVSKKSQVEVEKRFNKIGDVGLVALEFLELNKQKSLLETKKLKLQDISKSFENISKKIGTNSNKVKKEVLSKLFLNANASVEYKFLARLLIDDLRVGVSEGVLKEACVNYFFPKIVDINLVCSKCFYSNLNLKKCFKCGESLDLKNQKDIVLEKNEILDIETPREIKGLDEFDLGRKEEEKLSYVLRQTSSKKYINCENSRELYNTFLSFFERSYNTVNSFSYICSKLKKDLNSVLKVEIILNKPIRSMLGTRSNDVSDATQYTGVPAFCDFKYDGLRVQIHNNKGDVSLFSRNMENITKQFPEVVGYIKTNFSDLSFVIDSECCGFDFDNKKFLEFQMLSRRILSKNVEDVKHINVVVRVFDIMYLNGDTLLELPYIKRREKMEELFLNRELKQKIPFLV